MIKHRLNDLGTPSCTDSAQMAPHLAKGAHVLVQAKSARGSMNAPSRSGRQEVLEHVTQQLAVELKAATIRILDRTGNSEPSEATQMVTEEGVPF